MRLAAVLVVAALAANASADELADLGLVRDPDHASLWIGAQRLLSRVQLVARDAGGFTHVVVRFTISPSHIHEAVLPIELSREIRVVGMSITAGGRTDVAALVAETTAIHRFIEAHGTHAPALLVHDGHVLRIGVYVFDEPVVATLELELPRDVVLDVDPGHHLVPRFEIDLDGRPIHAGPVDRRTTIDFADAIVAPFRATPNSLDATTAFLVTETGARPRPRPNQQYSRATHRPDGVVSLSEAKLVAAIAGHAIPLSHCLALGAAHRAVEREPMFDEPVVVVTIEAGVPVDILIVGVALAAERTCIASEVMTWRFVDADYRRTLRARVEIPDRDNFDPI